MSWHHVYEAWFTAHGLYDHFVNGSVGSNVTAGLLAGLTGYVAGRQHVRRYLTLIRETHGHAKAAHEHAEAVHQAATREAATEQPAPQETVQPVPPVDYAQVVHPHRAALDQARRIDRSGTPLSKLSLARALIALDEALRTAASTHADPPLSSP